MPMIQDIGHGAKSKPGYCTDCIECGCYATGGNFSGFKSIPQNWRQGFPIAEIAYDGSFDIALQDGARGLVSRDTITAQLVYEIQVSSQPKLEQGDRKIAPVLTEISWSRALFT